MAKKLAQMGGFYWLPCPLCGEYSAGFEDGGYGWVIDPEDPEQHKWSVCPDHGNIGEVKQRVHPAFAEAHEYVREQEYIKRRKGPTAPGKESR